MEKREIEVAIEIKKIKENSFSLSIPDSLRETINHDNIKIGIGVALDPEIDKDLFTVHVAIKYKYDEDILLEYKVSFTFTVENIDQLIKIKEAGFQTNVDFIPELLRVSVGALRGMLAIKTIGTILADDLLPIIDINQLLNNNNDSAR